MHMHGRLIGFHYAREDDTGDVHLDALKRQQGISYRCLV